MIEIVTGDCREVLKAMRSGSFHACITDPPYKIAYIYRNVRPKRFKDTRDTWYHSLPPMYHEWIPEIVRVLKPGSAVMIFEASNNWHELYDAMVSAGIIVKHTLVWCVTNRHQPYTSIGWSSMYDVCIYGVCPPFKARNWNDNGGNLKDFNDTYISTWQTAEEDVAGVKPIPFLRSLIRVTTRPGNRIIDPFMGSGTTLMAAKLENRESVGIEFRRDIAIKVKQRLTQRDKVLDDFC